MLEPFLPGLARGCRSSSVRLFGGTRACLPRRAHGRVRPPRPQQQMEFVLGRPLLRLCLELRDAVVGQEAGGGRALGSRGLTGGRGIPSGVVGSEPRKGYARGIRIVGEDGTHGRDVRLTRPVAVISASTPSSRPAKHVDVFLASDGLWFGASGTCVFGSPFWSDARRGVGLRAAGSVTAWRRSRRDCQWVTTTGAVMASRRSFAARQARRSRCRPVGGAAGGAVICRN